MSPASIKFKMLTGLPAEGPAAEQFTYGSKRTHTEGFVVEVEVDGSSPWIGNFQHGLASYSGVEIHPNGQDLIVIAGGKGYVVRPTDRALIETFGGGVSGMWRVSSGTVLIFDDYGISFSALDASGWRWKTRRISWDGFDVLTVGDRRIDGRAWNAVQQQWQPFAVDVVTGAVSGAAYDEMAQQAIAVGIELNLRRFLAPRVHPVVGRISQVLGGIAAIALGLLTFYEILDGVRTGEFTRTSSAEKWGAVYVVLFLAVVVLVLGARLIFPSLRPDGRLLTRSGMFAFFGLYLAMLLIVVWRTGTIPVAGIAVIVGFVIGIGLVISRSRF